MNTILITGGELPKYKYVKDLFNDSYICVADSGLDWVLDNNIEFDYLVGDMDSLKNRDYLERVPNEKKSLYSVDKDDTDTVIGLKLLKKLGYEDIVLVGGGGGRLDHLLGVYSLFNTDISPGSWYTHRETVIKVKGRFDLGKYFNSNISIYPLNKVHCSIKSYGLKWELEGVNWKYKSIGISNNVIKKQAWIDTFDNELLIIVPLVGKEFD